MADFMFDPPPLMVIAAAIVFAISLASISSIDGQGGRRYTWLLILSLVLGGAGALILELDLEEIVFVMIPWSCTFATTLHLIIAMASQGTPKISRQPRVAQWSHIQTMR